MKSGIILDGDELRKVIAWFFEVPLEKVIRIKYSYTVIDAKTEKILELEGKNG